MLSCPVCKSYLQSDPSNMLLLKCPSCNYRTFAQDLVTKQEILMGRDVQYPLTPELQANLDKLHNQINMFRAMFQRPLYVTSGYRPGTFNVAAKGGSNSAHLTCEACDFRDDDGSLDQWCLDNASILETLGLWQESPASTVGWCHLQIRPASQRVFNP